MPAEGGEAMTVTQRTQAAEEQAAKGDAAKPTRSGSGEKGKQEGSGTDPANLDPTVPTAPPDAGRAADQGAEPVLSEGGSEA